MINAIWLEANWKKGLWITNFAMAALVWGLAWVDIYQMQMPGVMTLVHLIQFLVLGASGFALYKENVVSQRIMNMAMNHKAVIALKRNDFDGFKKAVLADKAIVKTLFSNGNSLLGAAAYHGNSKMVQFLMEQGADITALTTTGNSPLAEAAFSASNLTYELIRKKLTDAQVSQIAHTMGISELFFAAYEGKVEKVKQLATRANVNQGILNGVTPLHLAVLGTRNAEVIELLVNLGANPNAICHLAIRDEGVDVVEAQGFSPSMLAVLFKDADLALFFYSRNHDLRANDREKDHVMLACELGVVKYVDALMDDYDWTRKDRHNKTALDYAKQVGNQSLVNKINHHLSQATSSSSPSSKSKNVNATLNSSKNLNISNDQIEAQIAMSLEGLVGFDNFIQNLSHEVGDFLRKQPGESKGVVVWGDASVGKTEFAQRLAGLKQNFNIPGLNLDGVEVKYIACCDGQIDISKEANEAQPKSIIILDEIDKFFNPKSGIVDEAQAKKLRTSIVTNFQNKPIFWIFAGTFHDLRGNNRLNEKELSQVLGTELTSRLDFADWQLPSWSLESLLTAGQHFLNRDQSVVQYDDEGMLILVQQALDSGGGVRMLQKYHDYFKRNASKKGEMVSVTSVEAKQYLQMLK